MFNVYISCSVSRSLRVLPAVSLITLLIRTPFQMLFLLHSGAGILLSSLAGVCVCVRVSLFCLANALGFEELKPVVVFLLLCQFDQY